jgi:peptide/nickel transport system permease protein
MARLLASCGILSGHVHPLAILFLMIGAPAALALLYVFLRGSPSLRRYVVTRVALTIPMVLILATLVFLVLRIIPGDPVTSSLGPKGSPELKERLREQLGLEDPMIVQYGRFLKEVVTFDFGRSLVGGRRRIIDEMGERFPATVELIVPATIMALLLGIVPGAFAASRRRKPPDYSLRLYSVVIYSMPIFWLGLLFQLLFAVQLGWFPVASRIDAEVAITLDRVTNILIIDSILSGNWAALRSVLHHLVLPVVTLGLILSGVFLRLTRINVIETLQQDYITAARARGIKERVVIYRHALQNALIPVITLIGLQVAILLAGAVLTETVFSWPGMGRYLVERISVRDYTAVQSVIAMFAIFVALISLAVDIVYSLLDPRVRY